MSENIKLKKGFEINLKGKAQNIISEEIKPDTFALKPSDFLGVQRGKVLVAEGDNVKAGTPLFFDKKMESVLYSSPVSGEVVEIRRGAKRKLLEVVVLPDHVNEFEDFGKMSASDINNLRGEEARQRILKSGVWPNIIQRPYGIVANPDDRLREI